MTAIRRVNLVWALLVSLTLIGVLLHETDAAATGAATAIICIAMLKVYLVGTHFMDLRIAPRGLRLAFDGWVLGIVILLTAIQVLA